LSFTYGTRSLEGVDNTDDQFAFPQDAIITKHPANDEKSRLVANWTLDVPYAFGVQFSGLVTLGSGRLFNVGSRFDLANFSPGAFAPPKSAFLIPADLWRYRNVDLRLRKDFPNLSGTTLAVTLDLFNAFNFNNYSGFNLPTNTSDPDFGKPNGVGTDPRRLQLGAELAF
jgi:hypothetical protein